MKNNELLNKIKSDYDMYYVAVSGGKDSTATLLWCLDNLPKEKIKVFFIDIGNESTITLDYIRYLEQELKHRIWRITPKKTFSELILEKKFFPSPYARFCTNLLKIEPAKEILNILKGKKKNIENIKNTDQIIKIKNSLPKNPKILVITGVRADESLTRSKYSQYDKNNPLTQTDVFRPILYWSVEDVFNYLKEKKIKPNPLYEMGCSRVGCFPCIFAKEKEIKLLFENQNFEYDRKRIILLEEKIGRKFFIHKSLKEKYNYIKRNEKKENLSLFNTSKDKEKEKKEDTDICTVKGFSFCE